MLSGIGPGEHLRQHGIDVQLDRPGVGSNLMDHPAIHISGYLQPVARHKMVLRRNYTYLRWSSGLPDVPAADMVMMAVCRSAWHAIGVRIGTLLVLYRPLVFHGRGAAGLPRSGRRALCRLQLAQRSTGFTRMVDAFRRMARILTSDPVPQAHVEPVRLAILAEGTRRQPEEFPQHAADQRRGDDDGFLRALRKFLFDKVISDARPLTALLADPPRWSSTCAPTCSPPGIRRAPAAWATRRTALRRRSRRQGDRHGQPVRR